MKSSNDRLVVRPYIIESDYVRLSEFRNFSRIREDFIYLQNFSLKNVKF